MFSPRRKTRQNIHSRAMYFDSDGDVQIRENGASADGKRKTIAGKCLHGPRIRTLGRRSYNSFDVKRLVYRLLYSALNQTKRSATRNDSETNIVHKSTGPDTPFHPHPHHPPDIGRRCFCAGKIGGSLWNRIVPRAAPPLTALALPTVFALRYIYIEIVLKNWLI